MANRWLLLALLLSATCPTAWGQLPVAGEFQVNTYTTGTQYRPAAASDATGNFVVVWTSDGQDGSGFGVFGQRFNAAGLPQGSEFRVNSYTTGSQRGPAVTSDVGGNLIVVWGSNGQDGSSGGIFGQRFDSSGVPQGGEFQVNSYTTGIQNLAAVASDAGGNFVIVWQSNLQDGSGYGIFGQRFSASGVPQGSEFQVNSYTTRNRRWPAVTSDASGNFVVVWTSDYRDGSVRGVFGQRFSAAGVPQGGDFQVNSYTTNDQGLPAAASDGGGNFVVVWVSYPQDGSTFGAFGQRFNASGVPQGSEFRVNSYTTDSQTGPKVASAGNGDFVVAWYSKGQDGSGWGIFGQRFNASGVPQGSEFQVNTFTTGYQRSPAVASTPNGNFVVVWGSDGQDGSYGVFGQRFGDLIFKDGFQ